MIIKRAFFLKGLFSVLLMAISWTANAKTEYNYGCQGDITIYVGEERTLYHPFPTGVYVNASSGGWFLREGTSSAWSDGQENDGAKIVSKNSSSCTLRGMWDNTGGIGSYTLKLYCIGTKQSQNEEYVCYWNIIVKSRGTVTVSASPSGGTVEKGTKVYLTASVSGSEIYYTTNGDIPNKNSTVYTSSGITINKTTTLKAVAYKSGYENTIGTWYYTVNEEKVVAEINAENFPDEHFRNYLLSQSYGNDGILTENEIGRIDKIDVSGRNGSPGNISSLKGIEYFTALTSLDCDYNQLTTLDVSKNTSLTWLGCDNNQLTTLDVSKNTSLTTLGCGNNQLTSLDVSNNTALTTLGCIYNQLTSLDVSNNTALTKLQCSYNSLITLDVSKNIALTYLGCARNQLTSLDISKNTALTWLQCFNNQLTSLTLSYALTTLQCSHNQLSSLDVSKSTSLKSLSCEFNNLTSLDLSKNAALTSVRCYINQIKGVEMDNLISSLPVNNTGEIFIFVVVDPDIDSQGKKEGNICTKTQVAAVKAKGWLPCYYNSEEQLYMEYEGCEVPESITLPSPVTVSVGQTIKLTPTIMPSDAAATLKWTSDDETIATVDANGVVTGIKKGMTFINVETDNGKTAYCKLTVTSPEPLTISLPKNVTVSVGGNLTLTPTITPEDAETTLTWTSDDESIVRVDANGMLTGVAEGLALVTVSTSNGLTSNACKVKVEPDLSGIVNVQKDEKVVAPIYTTSGQRLTAPKKGINIIGGKKVIVQ